MKAPAVYILASQRNGTLYIGVTSHLIQRIWQHREGVVEGFTQQYGVKTLVWYEQHETMESAIGREKALKKWNRDWKLRLIEKCNPQWLDLWPEITGEVLPRNSPPQPSSFSSPPSTRPPSSPSAPYSSSPNAPYSSSPNAPHSSSPNVFVGDPKQSSTSLDSRLRGNDDGECKGMRE